MSERPSWMPSNEEIASAFYGTLQDRMDWKPSERIHRLIERTSLKAQIEALEEDGDCVCPVRDFPRLSHAVQGCAVCLKLESIRARLAELEAKP